MQLAHKIALDPTTEQAVYFRQAVGTARLVWNVALTEWNHQYAAGGKPNGTKLKKWFNGIKYQQAPWLKNIHRDAHARPFHDLQQAFVNWWEGNADRPVFKKKKDGQGSFYVANDKIRCEGTSVTLPKIGRVKMREALRFAGKICGATVSQEADRWFIAIQVEVEDARRERTGNGVVGVDLGLTTLATLSTKEKVAGPKALKKDRKSVV